MTTYSPGDDDADCGELGSESDNLPEASARVYLKVNADEQLTPLDGRLSWSKMSPAGRFPTRDPQHMRMTVYGC